MKKLLLLSLVVCLASCSLFDNFDEIPMFLDIPSVAFETSSAQGFNTNKITAVEAFAADLMRPMIREWLDEHLPEIVEKLVKAELEERGTGDD